MSESERRDRRAVRGLMGQRAVMRPRDRLAAICSVVAESERGSDPLCRLLDHLGVKIPPSGEGTGGEEVKR